MGDASNDTQRTLWIGDLGYWMDENFLYSLFAGTGTVTSVKIIRSKATNVSEGYGFIEFSSHEAASQILTTYNGCPIPGTDQIFRLNWAAFGVGKGSTEAADHSVFVGDLAPDVTDYVLQEHFRQYFPSVRSAKVITDPLTSRSKGYGFVRFGSEPERDRALGDMSGHFISNRPIRVSLATAKKSASLQPGAGSMGGGGGGSGGNAGSISSGMQGALGDLDPSNTTLFIGGLSAAVTEDQLRAIFLRFGEIVYVKIPAGKGCGFVQFMGRPNAEAAMLAMNGQMVGATSIRISWGRSSANRHTPSLGVVATPPAFPQMGNGAYGYPTTYGDPTAAYATAPYGTAPNDPYAAFYAQQVAAAAGADPYAAAAYGLYGSPGGLAGMGAGPGGMPVGTMAASAFGSAHMGGAQLGQMGNGLLGQVPLAGGGPLGSASFATAGSADTLPQLQASQQGRNGGGQQGQAGHMGSGQLGQQGRGSGAATAAHHSHGSARNDSARIDMGSLQLGGGAGGGGGNHVSHMSRSIAGGGGTAPPSRSGALPPMPPAPASSGLAAGLEVGMRSLDISGGGDGSSAHPLHPSPQPAPASDTPAVSQKRQPSPAPSPPLQASQ